MAKATTKTTKKSDIKSKTNNIKKTIKHGFDTLFTVLKTLGSLGGGAYLVLSGIEQNNIVFMSIGAIILAYGIIVLVSLTHTATRNKA